jgi:hypothetical protein
MEKTQCKNCHHENSINARYCSDCGYELPRNVTDNDNMNSKIGTQKSKIDKKNIIGAVIGAIIFSLVSIGVKQLFVKSPSYDKVLMQVASELNKTCPIMVDEYLQLDNSIALPGNVFQYNYTLVDIIKSDVNIDTLKKYFEPSIITNIRTNPDLKFFRDNKTTMAYYYKDKNGEFVYKFSVTPDQYKTD